MSGIIPFDQCLARPGEEGLNYRLEDHLLGVKEYVENRLALADPVLIKLAGLAGICHDAAKAHVEWQLYITGKMSSGPNHAPEGAFLFSYLGYHLLKQANRWNDYAAMWLWLTRDIADHHGRLKNINENRWIGAGDWRKIDTSGLTKFIHSIYPELQNVLISEDIMLKWTDDVNDIFEEAADILDLGYKFTAPLELMKKLSYWREFTTALIAGDRFNISPTDTTWLDNEAHKRNQEALDKYCRNNSAQKDMAELRKEAQKAILRQLHENPDQRFYTLEMPTGYGKTITALKLASWLGINQGYKKIIYVAPYLSILEQTSQVIEDVLDVSVLEHHSLAIFESNMADHYERVNKFSQLIMESWAHAIVCTSFQQWCKVLFPSRAQDVLRRTYLQNSLVIIDEPQIFAPEGWNVFLCGLQAAADLYNIKTIFLSATMPPFDYGLSENPTYLAFNPNKRIERYKVMAAGKMDEQDLAEYLLSRKEKCQAAILNTIGDAYLVYKKLVALNAQNLKLLHGMMVPLHKRLEITRIKDIQEQKGALLLVSTQVIEAGVDLSFGHIARALPILPSIVQAAGRVNRNLEENLGMLSLILFLRGGQKDTRGYIYPQSLLKLTDELLDQQNVWMETEILQLIKVYYKKMFEHNSYETGKQAIIDAYEGDWTKLSNFKPFGEDYFRLPVFVPWQVSPEYEQYLPAKFIELQRRFNICSPLDLYEHYSDKDFYLALSFEKRKEFMILFNHYVVNVPANLAISITDRDLYLQNRIPILLEMDDYDPVAGLAKRFIEGFDNII